jgi:membrane-associated protein
MENLMLLFDYMVHLDTHLLELIKNHGNLIYPLIYTIILCETGFIVAAFLPGDSLIFIIGTLCAGGELNMPLIAAGLFLAAVTGNCINYAIGGFMGPKFFKAGHKNFFREEQLAQAHLFYEKHGGKTILIARFIPVIRSFAPFIAGIGSMNYAKFFIYNIIGAFLWVGMCLFAGYFFGNIPMVEDNFTMVLLVILLFSTIPVGIGLLWQSMKKMKKNGGNENE